MTPSKTKADETLRAYALDNLRAAVRRLKDGDDAVSSSSGRDWRAHQLDRAVKWAAVADALRPEPPRYYVDPVPSVEVRAP